ncbi:MAG: ribulose-phosphate 3-epimerase [Acidimicrobiia bacterium]|nr:ribulose-phosphate 3-epimerase [Acidimicrobiia bacterium]
MAAEALASDILIAPSVLPANFARLGEECVELERAGADRIHWDVMDGRFVPNLTFGPDIIASIRPLVSLPFEAHLMVQEPHELAPRYAEAGCELLIVHAEACPHLHRTLGAIRDLDMDAGVALNPGTPASAVAPVLDMCRLVLVMTVNPGWGGQHYIRSMETKITEVQNLISHSDHEVEVEVDGGVGPATIGGAAQAGAKVFVAGSAIFSDTDGYKAAIHKLRTAATTN